MQLLGGMTTELRPEILTPVPPHVRRLTLAGLVGCVGMAALGVSHATRAIASDPVAAIVPAETVTIVMPVPENVTMEVAPAPSPSEVQLVFAAGGATYMKLAELDGEDAAIAMPKHGKPRLSELDYVTAAVAAVAADDVPLAYRTWRGQRVVVDNTCTARVTGFAVVARLIGDPAYASDSAGEAWTARSVLELGTPVLAARLEGCVGTGTFARAASLPPVVVPRAILEPTLVAAAKAALLASPEVKAGQAEWAEAGYTDAWTTNEATQLTTQIVQHPTTGVTWVSIHARQAIGCGSPNLNVWKLFRVDAGALVATPASLGEVVEIEQLVDLEGDGQLEVIGRPWLGQERVLSRASGETLTALGMQFYGCPC